MIGGYLETLSRDHVATTVSIQTHATHATHATQALALRAMRALCKRKPQATQALDWLLR